MRKYLMALSFFALLFPTAGYTQDWSGPYIGIHGGYASADWSARSIYEPTPPCPAGPGCATFHGASEDLGSDGAMGGIQAGINWQTGNIVYGVEADISASDLDASETLVTDRTNNVRWAVNGDIEGFGSLRGRLGFTSGSLLVYGTAGVAWVRTSSSLIVTQNPTNDFTADGRSKDTETGWTIGGGAEWKIAPSLSLKTEYLYADFGSFRNHFVGSVWNGTPHTTDSLKSDLEVHTFRVGLNYHFGQ